MKKTPTIDITLQGREYRVACAPEESEALLAAVALVEAKMGEIAANTKSSGERLAVMTALNLAHELLAKSALVKAPHASATSFDTDEFARRIGAMVARLDEAMAGQEKLF